jgi:hypothetical protein
MTLLEVIEAAKATGNIHSQDFVSWLLYYAASAQAQRDNLEAAKNYEVVWDNWLQNRNQRAALSLPPEIEPKPSLLIKIVLTVPPDSAAAVYKTENGPELCAEPNVAPATLTPVDSGVIVSRPGERVAGTNIWNSLPGDNAPTGHEVFHQGFKLRKKVSFPPHHGVYKLAG